jgi:hypothetical protein
LLDMKNRLAPMICQPLPRGQHTIPRTRQANPLPGARTRRSLRQNSRYVADLYISSAPRGPRAPGSAVALPVAVLLQQRRQVWLGCNPKVQPESIGFRLFKLRAHPAEKHVVAINQMIAGLARRTRRM